MTGGWIGVDLDGTLAEYHGWNDGGIGAPVPRMLARVKAWIGEGVEVKIVTARVAPNADGSNLGDVVEQITRIHAWCVEHVGKELDVTMCKDFGMIELWDDRAVTVEANTGRALRFDEGHARMIL